VIVENSKPIAFTNRFDTFLWTFDRDEAQQGAVSSPLGEKVARRAG
jgi:hypothetical protein